MINFFYGLPFDKRSWDLLITFGDELENLYWQTINIHWFNKDDCEKICVKLLASNRPYAALNLLVSLYDDEITQLLPSILLVDILEKAASVDPYTEKSLPDTNRNNYYIEEIFDVLDKADDIEDNKLAFLELIHFPLLVHSIRQPKLLYQQLSKDPIFFVEILKCVYKSEDDRDESVEIDRATLNYAKLGYKLLESWHQVPGLKEDGTVDLEQLRNWVSQARTASQESGRGKIADIKIGHILAYAPKSSDGIWPDIAVREIIEEFGSNEMQEGIANGVFNKRGVVTSAIGEGGIQERQLVETYSSYAMLVGDSYPRTAAMLRSIANRYNSSAHREDIRADLED
ncbi:MAG: hypothetical protein F6J90_33290 [Moorea sp. SIOASIH]|uniref:hypothetical protein n=1 Tax=Moorena sp. SIOASIH TaxID=2607817 RepID=UPI0013BD0C96|nr:hypothetical protein [Moorena sp. SIOASIH]NEO40945.1 hypothetical protein [Moorena sp. SIOASIH]